ncbi:hypothetical protein Poli38472_003919 [Pythium oligandrum]|uniref:BHLH domain-containing protein n=1 Tax=Pythium oligandrum TaxID=41045 RepID=A0A8K1CN47_PYTOL|nr:hypothetical protein Poli38472_003919 [Pythium oligandrum]|eukprot:TMW66154.1 hypothetical protein Poli38472_003919 [Pythium oligandrum]
MDFDMEMSGLQIEDMGEYFFPTEMNNDNWKGFSLGYMEEETSSAPPSSTSTTTTDTTTTASRPIAIGGSAASSRHHDVAAMLVSPPLLSSSFSEMLRLSSGNLAAAFQYGTNDVPMSPAATSAGSLTATGTTSTSTNPFHASMLTSLAAESKFAHREEDILGLANFSLDHLSSMKPTPRAEEKKLEIKIAPPPSTHAPVRPTAQKPPVATCQRIIDDEEDEDEDIEEKKSVPITASTPTTNKRPFEMMESCSMDSCSTIGAPEDDRGFRKKSREKMRRQEVNVKFDELIELLGLSNRVRKSAILQEAVSAIKTLKRERDDFRRERDRLQQEVSKLTTYLQYSQLAPGVPMPPMAPTPSGSSAQLSQLSAQAANAALSSMNSSMAMPSGSACFPIGSAFTATLTATSTMSNATPIAPKKS